MDRDITFALLVFERPNLHHTFCMDKSSVFSVRSSHLAVNSLSKIH